MKHIRPSGRRRDENVDNFTHPRRTHSHTVHSRTHERSPLHTHTQQEASHLHKKPVCGRGGCPNAAPAARAWARTAVRTASSTGTAAVCHSPRAQ